jgi:hypothetical protein
MRVGILISIIILSGCRGELFMSNIVPNVDFDEYETYAFLPGSGSLDFDDEVIRFRSVQKAQRELDERGFRMDIDSPDFFVVVHTYFNSAHDPTRSPDFRAPNDGFGPRFYFRGQAPEVASPSEEVPEVAYAPGTVVVEILDAADGALLWNAWSEQPIRQSALPEDLENYIGRLFENFPVSP